MIPGYQSIMLPLLELVSDQREYHSQTLIEELAIRFSLTDEERTATLPSGVQAIFDNRVGWAKTYLKKAGLLESPKRSYVVISELGLQALRKKPKSIDARWLRQFPSFIEFISTSRPGIEIGVNDSPVEESIGGTPEENLERVYWDIRQSLADELLKRVTDLSASFFERLVVELLVKMGYGGSIKDAGKAIGNSGDQGIDGIIKEDKLGLDVIYIQAKKWKQGNTVGRPEIQKFVGALAGQGAKKGVFITTSSFTAEALEYSPKTDTKIVLIDGKQLAQLMIDHNLGCTSQRTYEIKRIDGDYFEES